MSLLCSCSACLHCQCVCFDLFVRFCMLRMSWRVVVVLSYRFRPNQLVTKTDNFSLENLFLLVQKSYLSQQRQKERDHQKWSLLPLRGWVSIWLQVERNISYLVFGGLCRHGSVHTESVLSRKKSRDLTQTKVVELPDERGLLSAQVGIR